MFQFVFIKKYNAIDVLCMNYSFYSLLPWVWTWNENLVSERNLMRFLLLRFQIPICRQDEFCFSLLICIKVNEKCREQKKKRKGFPFQYIVVYKWRFCMPTLSFLTMFNTIKRKLDTIFCYVFNVFKHILITITAHAWVSNF